MHWTMEQKIVSVKTYYKITSFKIVQAKYRWKFNFYMFPNRSQIYILFKNFEPHGTSEDHTITDFSPIKPSITIQTR